MVMRLFPDWLICVIQKVLVCLYRTLNDDSPLGLRRILSQSTDSLSFRARAMSIESLADEGSTKCCGAMLNSWEMADP